MGYHNQLIDTTISIQREITERRTHKESKIEQKISENDFVESFVTEKLFLCALYAYLHPCIRTESQIERKSTYVQVYRAHTIKSHFVLYKRYITLVNLQSYRTSLNLYGPNLRALMVRTTRVHNSIYEPCKVEIQPQIHKISTIHTKFRWTYMSFYAT